DRLLEHACRDTARMERAHRELSAGFADGLRGDDAGGFAEFDEQARREIAAIAIHANALFAFARQHGTNFHAFQTGRVNGLAANFVNLFVRTHEVFLRAVRIRNVITGMTTDETLAEFDDFVITLV